MRYVAGRSYVGVAKSIARAVSAATRCFGAGSDTSSKHWPWLELQKRTQPYWKQADRKQSQTYASEWGECLLPSDTQRNAERVLPLWSTASFLC